ncbi:uncharacterized protein LOC131143691 isoform X2 [Malania oleifera]|uniref:uncharacterized protein LOC131143691 isoform X2 n=1 Tax=Malania oleifera TaxID=397392 RepID=UPI0025AE873B|nr:uncharacterized protein LOC131143691 isoform X2 [Malania oleifera]
MEMGCFWIRRLWMGTSSMLLLKPSMAAAAASCATFNVTSLPSTKARTLISLVSSRHRSSSRFASSSASLPAISIDEDDFDDPSRSGCCDVNENLKGSNKVLLKGMGYAEFEGWVQSNGYRPAQALMLWKRLYGLDIWAHSIDELDGLNKNFKKMLSEHAEFKALSLREILTASDGTRKILFTLDDGLVIETVVIPCDKGRNTVCVSSQVGCAMNCQFCYTGRMGLRRHLTAAEIVEQAVFARRLLSSEVGPITNVVFMGMGEPLQNIENVIKAANIMVHDQGLHFSPRKVTISTSGLVPQLKRFLHESNCALAVSLNATTDEVRNWIMPINRKYKLNLLLGTLREELRCRHNYKVLFEYVMLAGVNDSLLSQKTPPPVASNTSTTINI